MIVVLLVGCLERVTGEEVPLDPRFYAAVEAAQGDPGQGAGGIPFATYTGETVTIRGTIVAEMTDISVDLGVRIPDPTSEGGVSNAGKLLLDAAGPFELEVPKGLGRLELEALQDPDQDGPSGSDPYASTWVTVGEEDLDGIELLMEEGAFGAGGPTHTPAPPGAPGGDPSGAPASAPPGSPGGDPGGVPEEAPPGAPGGDPSGAPDAPPPGDGGRPQGDGGMPLFADYSGDMITVSGRLICEACNLVDLDLFRPNPDAPGGREMLGKIKREPGEYNLQVPEDFGPLLLEAFSDLDGLGPGAGDPMGRYEGNPLQVGAQNLSGIDITLTVTEDGRMPSSRPAPPPQQPAPPDQ